jgi:NADH:ubiquinone oxidoreductase subunit E
MGKFYIPETAFYICTGSKCSKRGSKDMYKHLRAYLKKEGLDDIELIATECRDRCKYAPVMAVQPHNIWLKEYTAKEVIKVLEKITGR